MKYYSKSVNGALSFCVSVSKFALLVYKKMEFKLERCKMLWNCLMQQTSSGWFFHPRKKKTKTPRLVRYGWSLLIYGSREDKQGGLLFELRTLLLREQTDHEQVWIENRKTFSCKSNEFSDSLTASLVETEALTEAELHLFRKGIFIACESKFWV